MQLVVLFMVEFYASFHDFIPFQGQSAGRGCSTFRKYNSSKQIKQSDNQAAVHSAQTLIFLTKSHAPVVDIPTAEH